MLSVTSNAIAAAAANEVNRNRVARRIP